MDNYWDNYIQTKIIQPLEIALQGNDPKVGTEVGKLYLSGKVWYVNENSKSDLLRTYMRPYIEEYLFDPDTRMRGVFSFDETPHAYWQRMGTGFVSDYLREHEQISTYFVGKDLHSVVETWLGNHYDSNRLYENRRFLISALREGFSTDWSTLHSKVIPELKDCPSDYDKIRLDYYCFLDAIIKVALDGNSQHEQKCEYWQQINQSWGVLSAIYSVMTGKLINTGFNHISPVISQFKGKNKEYATLMVAALRHHPEVLVNNKAWQIKGELEQSMREIKQNTELNDLCRILFPSAQWNDYNLKSPRLTTAEMMQKVRESEELKRLLKQVEEYARTLQMELDDVSKMQPLREAFSRLDPSAARTIFSQIDMVLEGNNDVWDKNRTQLKKEVNLRYENQQRMLEGTYQHAQLAAGFAQKAATRPVQQITNKYAPNSVRFEAGSTMNGDVITEI